MTTQLQSPMHIALSVVTMLTALITISTLAMPVAAEQHQHVYTLWPVKALPLPSYLTQTARDVMLVNVQLQRTGETFRLRVWYTSRATDGTETTWERRVDVKPTDLWVTAAFGGYEPGEAEVLNRPFVSVRFKEEAEPPAIAESVSTAQK